MQETQLNSVPRFYAITIPANTGDGDTLHNLLIAAGYVGSADGPRVVTICEKIPAGTDRAAIVLASPRLNSEGKAQAITATDYSTHGRYVDAGVAWYSATDKADGVYLRSASASTVTAIVETIN